MGAAALGANAGEELGLSREPREKRPPFFLLGSVEAVGGGLGALRSKNICAAWCRTPLARRAQTRVVREAQTKSFWNIKPTHVPRDARSAAHNLLEPYLSAYSNWLAHVLASQPAQTW